ncbi:MAG TPA: type II toxin-antitoxin system HicA family toxin [bacterium]|nr:type II toxin-antitoxin system HicA family toxin [bacterium]
MKLPRDVSGQHLAHLLGHFGYQVTHCVGSHMRLTTHERGEHHVTIPAHESLRVGTLEYILASVAHHLGIDRGELELRLFGSS